MTVCKCGRRIPNNKRVVCFCGGDSLIATEVYSSPEAAPMSPRCLKCFSDNPGPSGICKNCRLKNKIYTKEDGPEIWGNLHSYRFTTTEEARAFFDKWMLTVPSFGCSCQAHWSSILIDLPPDFSSAKSFFKWGVDAHNIVNQQLSKPQFSYQDALIKYNQNLCID